MAFTDDAVKAKLSALNETQEGIVGVAQWILFHRRHADRTAQLWMQRLKESTPNKKLNLIYLANEVIQQSKMRKKLEFLAAYSPLIAEATTAAYKNSPSDTQSKIRRVIEVWRQRQIFDLPIQESIEKGVDEIDRTRSGRKAQLGGSLFSGNNNVPEQLKAAVDKQNDLLKKEIAMKPTVSAANDEFTKMTNPSNPIPAPSVHAHRLATLLKNLAGAESAVAESIKARQSLLSEFEKLLAETKTALAEEEKQKEDLTTKKKAIETKKRDVEDAIMRGLSAAETAAISSAPVQGVSSDKNHLTEPPRPDIEELTPPPMESFTPTGSPNLTPNPPTHAAAAPVPLNLPHSAEALSTSNPNAAFNASPGADLLSSLTHARPDSGINGTGSYKKRKMSRTEGDDEFAAFAGDGEMDGIDADVGGMI